MRGGRHLHSVIDIDVILISLSQPSMLPPYTHSVLIASTHISCRQELSEVTKDATSKPIEKSDAQQADKDPLDLANNF